MARVLLVLLTCGDDWSKISSQVTKSRVRDFNNELASTNHRNSLEFRVEKLIKVVNTIVWFCLNTYEKLTFHIEMISCDCLAIFMADRG